MILVLLGAPGSGKGTQAKQISAKYGWPQLSTGDMLRNAIKEGTQLGKSAKDYMDRGALVPDSVVVGLIRERSQAEDCRSGFILDGFPRNTAQAEALQEMLNTQGRAVERVVFFDIDESALIDRLSGRRTCAKCQAAFHVKFAPPKALGICDACGGNLIQRDDDQPEVIRNRLKVYREQTEPLIEYYKRGNKLRSVDAALPPEKVLNNLSLELTH